MKKGFAEALLLFDQYQLAKYQQKNNNLSLVDLINLVRPNASKSNNFATVEVKKYKEHPSKRKSLYYLPEKGEVQIPALEALCLGLLKNKETWESMYSEAGKGSSPEEILKNKANVWKNLLESKKLPYKALVMNLYNIASTCDHETLDVALSQLVDPMSIKKSLMLPSTYIRAYLHISKDNNLSTFSKKTILQALEKAMYLSSILNIEVKKSLKDKNVVLALDISYSMTYKLSGEHSQKTSLSRVDAAACFSAFFYEALIHGKANPELIMFSSNLYPHDYKLGSPMSVLESITNSMMGGTNTSMIFEKEYDYNPDIFILFTDEQQSHISKALTYSKRFPKAKILVVDMSGYGNTSFTGDRVFYLSGISLNSMNKAFSFLDEEKNKNDNVPEQIKEALKIDL